MAGYDREADLLIPNVRRLRIGWASPWNTESAIAAFGVDILCALRSLGHYVEVIRTEVGHAKRKPSRVFDGPIHSASDLTNEALTSNYDAIVINFGNHFPYHGGALPVMLADTPKIAILHDAWMGHFVNDWRNHAGASVDAWLNCFEKDLSGLAALCSLADSAIVHAEHYKIAAAIAVPGPVVKIPLAFSAPDVPRWRPNHTSLSIATIGHANPNKRLCEIIRALGASQRLRRFARFTAIGPIDNGEIARLEAVASRTHAPDTTFTGQVTDRELTNLIATTDVFCCLRYPLTEGASASVIMSMLSGRPVIVSDHGSYGELPDDVVLKCPPGHEAAYVVRHLEWIIDCPDEAREMAERGREYALRVNHPNAYTQQLVRLIDRSISIAPLLQTARATGRSLGRLGLHRSDSILKHVATSLRWMKRNE